MSSTPSYDSVISPSDVQAVLVDVPILQVSQKIIFHAAQALRHPFHEFPLTLTQDFYKKRHLKLSLNLQLYIPDIDFQFSFWDVKSPSPPNT